MTMVPFYFGPEGRELFGAHHPPVSRADRDTGVVLCNPFGREYLYSHRALRLLAQRLAEHSFHVLRFDYSSSGDSGGDCAAADARRWIQDVAIAVEELKDRAGIDRVCLVGLRLGGLLALHAASGRRDIEGLVLWEPLRSAREYIADLREAHQGLVESRELPAPEVLEDGSTESGGFHLPQSLLHSLAALDDSVPALRKPARRALVLRQVEATDTWVAELVRLGVKAEEAVQEAPSTWLGRGADGRVVVPGNLLQTIVNWVEQAAR